MFSSEEENESSRDLLVKIDSCIKPGGPDAQDLVKYWDGEDPELLRPTIDRLERAGLIKIVQRLGGPRPDVPDAYRLSEVAGVHAL